MYNTTKQFHFNGTLDNFVAKSFERENVYDSFSAISEFLLKRTRRLNISLNLCLYRWKTFLDCLVKRYGENRVDISYKFEEYTKSNKVFYFLEEIYFTVHFPEIQFRTVAARNSKNYYVFKDMYIRYTFKIEVKDIVNDALRFMYHMITHPKEVYLTTQLSPNLCGCRMTLTEQEFLSGYSHSHLYRDVNFNRNIPFATFCKGTDDFAMFLSLFKNSEDTYKPENYEVNIDYLLANCERFISYENTSGAYYSLKNVLGNLVEVTEASVSDYINDHTLKNSLTNFFNVIVGDKNFSFYHDGERYRLIQDEVFDSFINYMCDHLEKQYIYSEGKYYKKPSDASVLEFNPNRCIKITFKLSTIELKVEGNFINKEFIISPLKSIINHAKRFIENKINIEIGNLKTT